MLFMYIFSKSKAIYADSYRNITFFMMFYSKNHHINSNKRTKTVSINSFFELKRFIIYLKIKSRKMSKCSNPFQLHGKVTKDLRVPSQSQLNILQSCEFESSSKILLCRDCRKKIDEKAIDQPSTSQSTHQPMEVSPAVIQSSSSANTTTPSSDETSKIQYNLEKISNLSNHLGIKMPSLGAITINSAKYRAKVAEELCKNITKSVNELFANANLEYTDADEMVENLKLAFDQSSSVEEKIKYLKMLPKSWKASRIKEDFGATDYMLKMVRSENPSVSGISKLAKGRPSHPDEVKKSVLKFYLQDEISRPFPGRKDCLSIKLPNGQRIKEQKRLLMAPLNVLHQQYRDQNHGEQTVSFSVFKQLRPKYCVFTNDASAANICVCMMHENASLLVQALVDTGAFNDMSKTQLHKNIEENMVCKQPKDECFLRECNSCESMTMVSYVSTFLDAHKVQNISFSMWVTSPQCEIVYESEDIDSFLERLRQQFEKFVVHQFKVRKQLNFIKSTKETTLSDRKIMVQLDFAENYSCVIQDSIQSHYFSTPTVTIHPFVIFYKPIGATGVQTFSVVIISEVKIHNTVAVYAFQKHLMNILKDKIPNLEEILYLSDGCGEQYKNKKNFKNLCCYEKDFNIKAEWHFFPTAHGKGPCDGIGGTIKRMARDASLTKRTPINNALQFYNWATNSQTKLQFQKDWNFVYVSQNDFNAAEVELQDRFTNLQTLAGTKNYHQFKPQVEHHINASLFSLSDVQTCFPLHKKEKRQHETPTATRRTRQKI